MDNLFNEIFSIIDIDKIASKSVFDRLIMFLTNNPGPLREVCAYKIEEFAIDDFLDNNSVETILYAITDINPNVSRSICKTIYNNPKLQILLKEKIFLKIENILNGISEAEKNNENKSHAKNKIFFSLYWLLEALYFCIDSKNCERLNKIISTALKFSDYTIREKAAKLLSKINNPDIELLDLVKNDSNFYVNFYTNLYKI